jgi:hypothetical protein
MVAGIVIPQSLFFALWAACANLDPERHRYLETIVLVISWPELLLPRATFDDISGEIPVILFSNFIGYALLTYLVLYLWERSRKLKLP